MSMICKSSMLALVLAVMCSTIGNAAVPQLINYQGRLTTPAGQPVADGVYLMRFRIYDAPVGGTMLWDNGFRGVGVAGGVFSYLLGDSTALPITLFSVDTMRYLGIAVGVDAEMTPRTRLTSTSYGFKALLADTAVYAQKVSSIDGASAGTITGNLTVQGSAGNAAVVLPNSSISSSELLDEPGAVKGFASGVTPGGPTVLVDTQINCPAAGWIVAMATGEGRNSHVQGIGDNALVGLSESGAGIPSGQGLNIAVAPALPTAQYNKQVSSVGMFPVISAGIKTIYFVGQNLSGMPFTFFNCNIVLLYVPSSYSPSGSSAVTP